MTLQLDTALQEQQQQQQEDEQNEARHSSSSSANSRNSNISLGHRDSTTASAEKSPQFWDRNRVSLFVFSALYTALFGGAFLGFGPMQLLLEQDGAFANECTTTTTEEQNSKDGNICPDQTARLLQVVLVSQITSAFSPILGWVADEFGSVTLMNLLGLSACVGIVLIILASALEIYALLFPGFCLIGIMFVATSIMTVQTGLVFQGNARRQVISFLNNLLDAGAVTYLLLLEIANATNASFVAIMSGYLGLAIVCFGGASFYWVRVTNDIETKGFVLDDDIPQNDQEFHSRVATGSANAAQHQETLQTLVEEQEEEEEDEEQDDDDKEEREDNDSTTDKEVRKKSVRRLLSSGFFRSMVLSENEKEAFEKNMTSFANTHDASNTSANTNTDDNGTGKRLIFDNTKDVNENNHRDNSHDNSNSSYVLISKRSTAEQLKSEHYICVLLMFLCHDARTSFLGATARDFLASLGDDEHDNLYLSLFTYINVASIVALPFTDRLMDRYGYHVSFQIINAMAIINGIIQISSENLNVQVLGFVVFSFYRSLTFSAIFSYMPVFLGGDVVGRGIGVMTLLSGLFGLINIPLASLTVSKWDGNFFYANLFYTLLVIPFPYVAWRIGAGIEKEKAAAKKEPEESLRRLSTVHIRLSRRVSISTTPYSENSDRRISRFSVSTTAEPHRRSTVSSWVGHLFTASSGEEEASSRLSVSSSVDYPRTRDSRGAGANKPSDTKLNVRTSYQEDGRVLNES